MRPRLRSSLQKAFGIVRVAAPSLYLAGAIPVWLGFASAAPDGLANVWIALYTFPIVAVGTFVLRLDFPYVPGGYHVAHALYFWPSVALLAAAMFWLLGLIRRLFRADPAGSDNA
jgi:hypothetical protein